MSRMRPIRPSSVSHGFRLREKRHGARGKCVALPTPSELYTDLFGPITVH
jgi:hypothetical protein